MSNTVAWLVVSFAVMVVAVLGVLHEKIERLEKRLKQLEDPSSDDDSITDDVALIERSPWKPEHRW